MDLKEYRKKLIGNEDERAVSPVIGVILMVAITVILAAVIAAFVMDMGDSIGAEANAGANIGVDETGEEITTSWTSEGNSDKLNVTIEYTVEDEDGDTASAQTNSEISNVGSSAMWNSDDLIDEADGVEWGDNSDDKDVSEISGTITVTGEIDGGATTVITSDTFTFEDPEVDQINDIS